ncbi:HYC_CC_PP family protein [Spirosoma sp.]|uniref:HYC_CC_PP family protein n=1 Tax=Spirosoma sp. TaxID=1899569 RepID=UPI003B3A044E
MKRTLFRLFNLLMACVVLLSSTGFGLIEHTCQMRGHKTTMVVAFSEAKSQGCAIDQQPMSSQQTVIKKTECCQDDQRYENVDVSSSLSQLVAKFVKSVTETVVAGFVAVFSWLIEFIFAEKSASVSAFSSPPSLSGRDILTLVQSLLI